jgi:energy-coupling factor transporter ATP-binding protein EcfA2
LVNVKSIQYSDFKSFSTFTISSTSKNVLVGPNNAGKSTALDSFRILFDVLRYISRRNGKLKSQGKDGVCSTWFVPPSYVQSDLRYCVHNFGDGRARIEVKLTNGNAMVVLLSNDENVECYLKSELTPRINTDFLRDQFPLKLAIVPTLSPLEQNEELVQQGTVERNRYGRLASRNFRNFWLHRTQAEFERFADLVEQGWPGVRVQRPEIERQGTRPIVRMYFRDGPHVREVQWAGFGFQVWMQTMMHLCETDLSSTLVLDEPDIYLHPDLQHRLLRLVSQRVGQYFIATHSTEIINDVDPGEVLIMRPGSRSAKRITGDSGFSDVYAAIGSSENAQFARLAKTRRVLYFEGQDPKIFSRLARKLGGREFLQNSEVTIMKTDGFSNWSRVTTSSWVFNNFFGFKVPVAAIFDRDGRSDQAVEDFQRKTNDEDTLCRVLPCKEVENLLLVDNAICEVVQKFSKVELEGEWRVQVENLIEKGCEEFRSQTLSARIGRRIEFEVKVKQGKRDISELAVLEEREFTEEWRDKT